MSFIKLKIDVKKIDKSLLFEGKSAKYLDCTLKDNRDGKDQYGNDGFIVQDVSREAREAGERGPIVGNWKRIGNDGPKPQSRPQQQRRQPEPDLDPTDDIF